MGAVIISPKVAVLQVSRLPTTPGMMVLQRPASPFLSVRPGKACPAKDGGMDQLAPPEVVVFEEDIAPPGMAMSPGSRNTTARRHADGL